MHPCAAATEENGKEAVYLIGGRMIFSSPAPRCMPVFNFTKELIINTNIRRTFMIVAIIAIAGIVVLCIITGYSHRRIHRYDNLIIGTSRTHGVDPALVSSVIRRESKFNPKAIGKSGEIGLMQVTEPAALEWAASIGSESFAKENLLDPAINIQAGTWYLGRAIRRWSHKNKPLPYALAEYNAGRSNALRWAADDKGDEKNFIKAITYPSTRRYIEDVLSDYYGRAGAESNCISYRRR